MRNQGLLLSGALAYYTLLSIVPLSILALIGLSHFIEEEQLFHTLSTYMGMVIPGYAAILTEQVRVFLQHRQAFGIIGFLAMLFFSSMAFSVLENAMSVIFMHRVKIQRRHFLTSAVIPYVYILSIGLGIVLVSFITGALEILETRQLILFGWSMSLEVTAHFHISAYARGTYRVSSRIDRRDNRDNVMGDHPPCAGLVLLDPVSGKSNLWLVRDRSGGPSHYGGHGTDSSARCSGYCGT
jgi:uncharacterized BrkB/YihY/UPF0761 family membrane protein